MVGASHGSNPLPTFFSNVADTTRPGQFNLDFMTSLSLSALWAAWRHRFSAGGIALAGVAFFGGMMFLALYLLWATAQVPGDPGVLLLGKERAGR